MKSAVGNHLLGPEGAVFALLAALFLFLLYWRERLWRRTEERFRVRAEEESFASRQRLQALLRQLLAGQEIERRRLARELHDEIGQVLTVVSINLQGLKAVCGEEAAARLDESMATVARAIEQVRDLSLSLRPAMLDDFGLATALKWYVERLPRGSFEVVLNVETSGERLPGDVEVACFRAVQEALTNAARHARARHVWVDLRQRDEEVELVVRDDGVGFDLAEARRRGVGGLSLGLLGMQERIELLGGQFEIDTAPGRGTVLRIRLPALGPAQQQTEGQG